MLLSALSGCTTDQSTEDQVPVGRFLSKESPQELIRNCLNRYRNARSYEDRATVTLRYRRLDENSPASPSTPGIEETSPVRIAYEAPNRIAMEAYLVRCTWQDRDLHAVVGDDQSQPVGKQRMVRRLPDQLTHTWLLGEPLLERFLSAGVVGAPMQLDLLWSTESLEQLFLSSGTTLSMMEPAELQGRRCWRVAARTKDSQSILWVDAESGLLRRFQLPTSALASEVLVGHDPKSIDLTIDFQDARLNQPIDWKAWEIPDRPGELLVRRFVLPPPPLASDKIGQPVEPFDLLDERGNRVLDSQQRVKPVTVLCWMTDHPACQHTAQQMMQVEKELEKRALDSRVQIILVWATQEGQSIQPRTILQRWNCALAHAVDPGTVGRDRFGVREAPSLVVLDSSGRVQWFEERSNPHLAQALPDLLQQVAAGGNLAKQMLDDYAMDQGRYAAQLHMQSLHVRDPSLPAITPFWPFLLRLTPAWEWSAKGSLVAAAGFPEPKLALDSASTRAMLVLDRQGQVQLIDFDGQGKPYAQLPIEPDTTSDQWQIHPQSSPGPIAAITCTRSSRYWLLEGTAGQAPRVSSLASDEHIVLAQWADWSDATTTLSLVVATDKHRVLMLNVATDQLLSGEAPGPVMAVAPAFREDGAIQAWNAVLEDGQVQALIAPHSSARSSPTSLQDPPTPPVRFAAAASGGKPAPATGPAESIPAAQQLPFRPERGHWLSGRDSMGSYVFGLGRVEGDRAAMMLDRRFSKLWHFPLAVDRRATSRLWSSANDGSGQQLFWLIQSPDEVLHLVRADGKLAEPVSWGEKIVGAHLTTHRQKLWLLVAFVDRVMAFEIRSA